MNFQTILNRLRSTAAVIRICSWLFSVVALLDLIFVVFQFLNEMQHGAKEQIEIAPVGAFILLAVVSGAGSAALEGLRAVVWLQVKAAQQKPRTGSPADVAAKLARM